MGQSKIKNENMHSQTDSNLFNKYSATYCSADRNLQRSQFIKSSHGHKPLQTQCDKNSIEHHESNLILSQPMDVQKYYRCYTTKKNHGRCALAANVREFTHNSPARSDIKHSQFCRTSSNLCDSSEPCETSLCLHKSSKCSMNDSLIKSCKCHEDFSHIDQSSKCFSTNNSIECWKFQATSSHLYKPKSSKCSHSNSLSKRLEMNVTSPYVRVTWPSLHSITSVLLLLAQFMAASGNQTQDPSSIGRVGSNHTASGTNVRNCSDDNTVKIGNAMALYGILPVAVIGEETVFIVTITIIDIHIVIIIIILSLS